MCQILRLGPVNSAGPTQMADLLICWSAGLLPLRTGTSVLFGTAAILGAVVERELLRWLVDPGGPAAERCLWWLVDDATERRNSVDLMWPAVPWVL
jgi:hypothetical protein